MSSVFTKILNWEIKRDILYEDKNLFVIETNRPEAKIHLLIIPKKEIVSIEHLSENDKDLIADIFFIAQKIARELKINDWYELHFNVWGKAWQEVMHLHLHLLSNI